MEATKLVLPETEEVFLNAKAFERMRRLRLLIIHNHLLLEILTIFRTTNERSNGMNIPYHLCL